MRKRKINILPGLLIFLFISFKGMTQGTLPNSPNGSLEKIIPGDVFISSFIGDSVGNIYGLLGRIGSTKICKLVNDTWVEIPIKIADDIPKNYVYNIWFTKKGQLVAECLYSCFYIQTNDGWEKAPAEIKSTRYIGNEKDDWSEIPAPPEFLIWDGNLRLGYPLGKYLVRGRHRDKPDNILIYEYKNKKWNLVFDFSEKMAGDTLGTGLKLGKIIVSGKQAYILVHRPEKIEYNVSVISSNNINNDVVVKSSNSVINKAANKPDKILPVNQKQKTKDSLMSLIPIKGVDSTLEEIKDIRKTVILFDINGKKGLKNLVGDTLIYPLFNSITLENSISIVPEKEDTKYAFHLIGDEMDLYSNATADKFMGGRLKGFIISKITCPKCKGVGKLQDEIRKEEIRKWVPEKKEFVVTGTSTASSGQYNPTTKKYEPVKMGHEKVTPGHYEGTGKYKTEIVPGAKCDECKNGFSEYVRNWYIYKSSIHRYLTAPDTTEINPRPVKRKTLDDIFREQRKKRGFQ